MKYDFYSSIKKNINVKYALVVLVIVNLLYLVHDFPTSLQNLETSELQLDFVKMVQNHIGPFTALVATFDILLDIQYTYYQIISYIYSIIIVTVIYAHLRA